MTVPRPGSRTCAPPWAGPMNWAASQPRVGPGVHTPDCWRGALAFRLHLKRSRACPSDQPMLPRPGPVPPRPARLSTRSDQARPPRFRLTWPTRPRACACGTGWRRCTVALPSWSMATWHSESDIGALPVGTRRLIGFRSDLASVQTSEPLCHIGEHSPRICPQVHAGSQSRMRSAPALPWQVRPRSESRPETPCPPSRAHSRQLGSPRRCGRR